MSRFVLAGSVVSVLALAACAGSTPPPVAPPPAPVVSAPPVAPAPPSADPAPITEGDVTVAFSRGMEILVKKTPGAEFVAAQLCIRGGVRNWTKDNAGIENVALAVATSGGTQSLNKDIFSRKLAALGATLGGGAGNDFSTLTTKAPTASWDELFPIFAETFLAPALPPSELEIVKQRELSDLRHELEDGDGRLRLLVRKSLFVGHPYLNRPVGTIESVGALKDADLAPYLATLRDTSRLVLIVVGDVDPSHVIDQAKKAFASVPRGQYAESPLPQLHYAAPHVAPDPFKLPTNYVESAFSAPAWSDPDFISVRIGITVLNDRVFDEVRTKRNLSYAPGAFVHDSLSAPYGGLYVTAVDPNAAMKVMFDEARRLQTDLVPSKELEGEKSTFVTGYLQGHETSDGLASELGEALLIGGDWHLAGTLLERVHKVTPEALRDAAHKWLVNMQTEIVGDPSKLDPKIVGAP
jgi:zinc protease